MARPTVQTRLCPHCANSIALDALTCPYCRADLSHGIQPLAPEWPQREEDIVAPPVRAEKAKLTVKSKAILIIGLLVFALGVYLAGGNRERSDLTPKLTEQQEGLREKDEKIRDLQTQLSQLRQDHQGSSEQIAELKAKLEESQKDLAATRTRLTDANREIDRLTVSRVAGAPRPTSRTIDSPPPAPASSARASRAVEPGTYEVVRAASVYEEPAGSSRVVTQIARGTQVTVVRSVGDWLEIRSKHGNPPGYIRVDDASLIGRSN
jgi:Bacterial SH3 domain